MKPKLVEKSRELSIVSKENCSMRKEDNPFFRSTLYSYDEDKEAKDYEDRTDVNETDDDDRSSGVVAAVCVSVVVVVVLVAGVGGWFYRRHRFSSAWRDAQERVKYEGGETVNIDMMNREAEKIQREKNENEYDN